MIDLLDDCPSASGKDLLAVFGELYTIIYLLGT